MQSKILMLRVIVSTMIGCSSVKEKRMLKKAVQDGVPKTARWIGGKDGGEWVNFTFNDSIFHIDTYNDFTHQFKLRYTYKIVCPEISTKKIKKSFMYTNGYKVVWDTRNSAYSCIKLVENNK